MPTEEFTFDYGGRTLKTGMQTPETKPLSFVGFGEKHEKKSFEDLAALAPENNPNMICVSDIDNGFGKNLDWFDQGGLSSCNAYMIAWIICVLIWRQTGKKVRLSPEFVYMLINGNKDEGSMLDDGMLAALKGMPKYIKALYELFQKDRVAMEDWRRASQSAEDHCFQECFVADTGTFEDMVLDMLTCLADGGACGCALHVARGGRYLASEDMAGFDKGPGNHAVPAVSYKLKTPKPQSIEDFLFLVPGTWNKGFGKNGFVWCDYKHWYEPGAIHTFYCVTAVSAILDVLKNCLIK